MDTDDDMILVIIEDQNPKKDTDHGSKFPVPFVDVKNEPIDEEELVDLIETAKKYGQRIDVSGNEIEEAIKQEHTNLADEYEVKVEYYDSDEDYVPKYNELEEEENYLEEDYSDTSESSDYDKSKPKRTRWTLRSQSPSRRKSFVNELRQEYVELRKNEKALVNTLSEIMRTITRPEPPKDYCIVNDTFFECKKCGAMTETLQAYARHYQEKHGSRYLVCFACGVDFRSTTNLYKHEKRCTAPDATIVLKARAIFLGRKGRSRPFLLDPKDCILRRPKRSRRFHCTECTAAFSSKPHLEAHENLHKGLRPFRCHVCCCAYTSEARLKRHLKKHSNEQYICDHCGRSFKLKAALVVHMNTHMALPKFPCAECPKRYSTKHALDNHVRRIHLNLPPPCACPVCPASYSRMSLVRDHMQKTHGMTLMTRKMFFKALPTLSEEQLKLGMDILKSSNTVYFYNE